MLPAASRSLPRVGLAFRVAAAAAQHATWYGRGPFENYPDRCSAAKVGVHAAAADELATPCAHPRASTGRV